MKKIRPRITPEEFEVIKGIRDACDASGLPQSVVPDGWIKTEKASVRFKNPSYQPQHVADFNTLREVLVSDIQQYKPTFRFLERQTNEGEHLFVISMADVHIGKLATANETGEEYNSDVAIKRCIDGVEGLLQKSSGFKFDKILFVGGNDILHVDTPRSTTTSGTPQDTDGYMWYEHFMLAKDLYITLLERLLVESDVHFVYNPSNHDYQSGFMLAQVIEAYFANCKNITFDNTIAHRKYFSYGTSLIGTTHGDGAKTKDLPLLMANESKDWVACPHRYIYTHHIHHKDAKDAIGVSIESMRSPSPADSWHHRNGYQHAPQAIEAFVHSKEHGQSARFTHRF